RDPRLEETLADFDEAVNWLVSQEHEHQALEEAILGVIGQIDKPKSPAGEAKVAYHNLMNGRTPEQRERFRTRVLNVTLDDLKRVAQTYLVGEASIGVVTNAGNRGVLERLGLTVSEL
ncbi:MAG: peptidase M16, partial [Pseudomonadales bacterium]|nr:peptidase M16 [Pseudomonadales bacterium]